MNLFKVHIFSIVHTDIDLTATEWMHQCLQSHAKRIQGHETEPYPWSITICIDPNPRVVVVEGFLVNALQCKKVNAIYGFTNSDLRNVIHS